MWDFAQELVDLVPSDNVAATANAKDIGTCGRVCRRWLPRSRMHLFSSLTLRNALSYDEVTTSSKPYHSDTDHNTAQPFFHFIDSASIPILPLVRTLHLRRVLNVPWVPEQHMKPLQNCRYLRELRIDGFDHSTLSEELEFVQWVHTHILRFWTACPSLTRLDLGLPTHLPLNVLADLMWALPFLTGLRLSSSPGHGAGIVEEAGALTPDGLVYHKTVPRKDAFPPNLHKLDIGLYCGTSLFLRWLLSHTGPPIFTSPRLGGCSRYEPIEIDAYLRRFGPRIESLALAYFVEDLVGGWSLEATRAFEARVLAYTPRLVSIQLSPQSPETIPATLLSLP
jgi:hypothetical protein